MRRRLRKVFDPNEPSLLLRGRVPLASLIQTLAVAEYLNFRHAANALGVSLSSVSARVKTLEENLGVLLFERHARGVRLTEAGRHFVQLVAAGVDQLDYAVKTASMAAHGECGRLRIGVHALIPCSFLAGLIERYREDHPGIEVEITEGTARDTVMHLRADRLDIVFVAGTPELPNCHSRQMWTEPLLAALPDRHRLAERPTITWVDLTGEIFLVRHSGPGPQVHDHIVLRLAGRWPASPSNASMSSAAPCFRWSDMASASPLSAGQRRFCKRPASSLSRSQTNRSRSHSQPCGRLTTRAPPSETCST